MNKIFVTLSLAVLLVVVGFWIFVFSPDKATVPTQDTTSSNGATAETTTIIAFGDSLTAGYGVSQAEAYPAQLEIALREKGYDVQVVNAGVSGETTRGNLERALFVRSQEPEFVIVGIGGNDALRALPVEETEKNIRATIDVLQGGTNPPQVLLLQMQAPLNAGLEYKKIFDALYEEIAREKSLVLVPFITEEIYFDTTNKLPDGIHYNKLGYQKVVGQHILPNVTKLLEMGEIESRGDRE